MAEKIRYTRKDLKGPDEFISAFGRAAEWARENRAKVLAAAGVVTLLVAGVLGVQAYLRWEESKANSELWPHMNKAREVLLSPSTADRDKLAGLEQFLSAHINKHPGTAASVYARYYLAGIAFIRGNYDGSAAQYRAAIDAGKAEGIMPFLLRTGLAQALEAKGDFAGASERYREAAAVAAGELRTQAQMGEARVLHLSGKKKESAALYRQILTSASDPRTRELVEIKLAQAE
jgi:hypothetical protein